MSTTDRPTPILITLDLEDILVLCTLVETFRVTADTCDMKVPLEVRVRIAGILRKMMHELEFQVEENN